MTANRSAVSVGVVLNGTDVTSSLKGPFTGGPVTVPVPVQLNISSSASEVTVALKNESGSRALLSWQLLVNVLR
jgi:hypothetical protein